MHLVGRSFFARALSFEKIERMGDEFGRIIVACAGELVLDALFEDGIEGERHGVSIPLD